MENEENNNQRRRTVKRNSLTFFGLIGVVVGAAVLLGSLVAKRDYSRELERLYSQPSSAANLEKTERYEQWNTTFGQTALLGYGTIALSAIPLTASAFYPPRRKK